ncbi:MAG: hypothetical protein WKI04_05280 [Ferruginibacter sp.]
MPSILFEIKDSVAIIRLNRPEKYNSFNREMALSFQNILDACAAEKTIRALYGNGKAFLLPDLSELVGKTQAGNPRRAF